VVHGVLSRFLSSLRRVEHVLLLVYGAGDRPVRSPELHRFWFRSSFSPR
jgi:hypothetical protein